MKIGITAYGMRASELLTLGIAADELGFHSLWLGEHLALPCGYTSSHPTDDDVGQAHPVGPIVDVDTPLVDPLVCFAAIAASTNHLELATGIYLLALRHPLLTARAVSTLEDIAGGRFVLGVGTGWLEEEFEAFGIPFAERVARFDDALSVVRAAWAGGPFEFSSSWGSTRGRIQTDPEPCAVPIVFGGNSERALERAARMADGWFASGMPDLDEFLRMRDRIEVMRQDFGRTGAFRTLVRVPSWEPECLEPYEKAGVDEVLVWARSPYSDATESNAWPPGPASQSRDRLAKVAGILGVGRG